MISASNYTFEMERYLFYPSLSTVSLFCSCVCWYNSDCGVYGFAGSGGWGRSIHVAQTRCGDLHGSYLLHSAHPPAVCCCVCGVYICGRSKSKNFFFYV